MQQVHVVRYNVHVAIQAGMLHIQVFLCFGGGQGGVKRKKRHGTKFNAFLIVILDF